MLCPRPPAPNMCTNFFININSRTGKKKTNMEDEEANSLITQGCKLAKDLESILANPDPVLVSKLCDNIINTFVAAKERLVAAGAPSSSLHEWARANSIGPSQPMDMWLQMQLMEGKGDMAANTSFTPLERGDHASNVDTVLRASSSQRPRSSRRKEDAMTVRVEVAAPQMGNTEIPPEDGFTWRKYGQKEILAARFPRGYYRCTHQKLYNCPAKKQVQRLDDDPSTFEVTYYGEHSCHKTDTAPSVAPPAEISSSHHHELVPSLLGSHSPPGPGWLEFSLGGGGAVVDLADTMFNSGSSSTNTMDFLFTHHHA